MDEETTKYSDGGVVTPLPPDKIHKVEGLITPKVPRQIQIERKQELSELPDDLKADE